MESRITEKKNRTIEKKSETIKKYLNVRTQYLWNNFKHFNRKEHNIVITVIRKRHEEELSRRKRLLRLENVSGDAITKTNE